LDSGEKDDVWSMIICGDYTFLSWAVYGRSIGWSDYWFAAIYSDSFLKFIGFGSISYLRANLGYGSNSTSSSPSFADERDNPANFAPGLST
jgi:hypothetical protein